MGLLPRRGEIGTAGHEGGDKAKTRRDVLGRLLHFIARSAAQQAATGTGESPRALTGTGYVDELDVVAFGVAGDRLGVPATFDATRSLVLGAVTVGEAHAEALIRHPGARTHRNPQ